MKGTRLWQDTGSPLISGRSRRERPFWKDWLWGSCVGLGVGGGLVVAAVLYRGGNLASLGPAVWVPAVPAALLGAASGVWIAAKFGLKRRWCLGAVLATPLVSLGAGTLGIALMNQLSG